MENILACKPARASSKTCKEVPIVPLSSADQSASWSAPPKKVPEEDELQGHVNILYLNFWRSELLPDFFFLSCVVYRHLCGCFSNPRFLPSLPNLPNAVFSQDPVTVSSLSPGCLKHISVPRDKQIFFFHTGLPEEDFFFFNSDPWGSSTQPGASRLHPRGRCWQLFIYCLISNKNTSKVWRRSGKALRTVPRFVYDTTPKQRSEGSTPFPGSGSKPRWFHSHSQGHQPVKKTSAIFLNLI